MNRKCLMCILCLIFVFTLNVMGFAQQDVSTTTDEAFQPEQSMPGGMGGRGGGRPGGMGGGMGGGQPPENMIPPGNSGGMPMQNEEGGIAEAPQGDDEFSIPRDTEASGDDSQMQMPGRGNQEGMMPDGGGFPNVNQWETDTVQGENSLINFVKEYQTPIISVVLLLLAFVFVKLYKRKNY